MKRARYGLEDQTAYRTRWKFEEGKSDQSSGVFLPNLVPLVDHQLAAHGQSFPLT